MALNQAKPVSQASLEFDRASLVALKALSDYAPSNAAISVEAISALEARLRRAEEAEILANKALAAARDARAAAGWDLHNLISIQRNAASTISIQPKSITKS